MDAGAGVLADRRHEPESHAVLIKERRAGFREIRPQLREFSPADHVEDARELKPEGSTVPDAEPLITRVRNDHRRSHLAAPYRHFGMRRSAPSGHHALVANKVMMHGMTPG